LSLPLPDSSRSETRESLQSTVRGGLFLAVTSKLVTETGILRRKDYPECANQYMLDPSLFTSTYTAQDPLMPTTDGFSLSVAGAGLALECVLTVTSKKHIVTKLLVHNILNPSPRGSEHEPITGDPPRIVSCILSSVARVCAQVALPVNARALDESVRAHIYAHTDTDNREIPAEVVHDVTSLRLVCC
jgi:hypothetical protein